MPPILLDLKTLSLVLILVTAFLTFVISFVRLTAKTYRGFGLWVISNIAIAAGIFLLGIDGVWTDLLGTSLTFGAVLLAYEGNRRFLRIKNTLPFSLGVFAFHTAGLVYCKVFNHEMALQVGFTSLLVGVISIICGFVFLRDSTERRMNFSYRFTGITYYIFALIMIFRFIITVSSDNNAEFYAPDGIQPVFFTFYILFEIVWTFNYINLNSNRMFKELEQTKTELEKLATTDYLTGINNNRRFFEIGEDEIMRSKRFRSSFSLIMFDIDFFKEVNDKFGHSAGDQVLVEIAETCRKIVRGTDTLGRLGGEEFAVILPHTDIDGAKTVAEFLRSAIEEHCVKFSANIIKVTASFGVTELTGTDSDIKIILDRADTLLYEAKNNGRNAIVCDNLKTKYRGLAVA